MKNSITLFVVLLFLINNLFSQVTNLVDVIYLKNGNIVRGYIIENNPNVDIKFKTIDGSIIIYSYNDFSKIEKEEYKDIPKNSNNRTPEKVIYDKETIFLVGLARHPSQSSEYMMIGKVKNLGGYLKLQSNLNFKGTFDSEGYSWSNDRYFNETVHTGRYGITGGVLWRAIKPIIIYGGLGYGNRWVNWETVSGDQFRVTDISYKGLEFETGVIFKLNKLLFTGGVSLLSFQYMELSIGAGFSF
jgi:hypothetical protein